MQMKSKNFIIVLVLIVVAVLIGYYAGSRISAPASPTNEAMSYIELAGPIADPKAEVSGLAWHGDTLILLPQYPERFGAGDGTLFAISKQEILKSLDGKSMPPVTPVEIKLTATGLKESIENFQGYEAIGFHGDQVFMTIEAGEGLDMHGYLVSGSIKGDEIKLDTSKVIEIPLPTPSENHTDEALIVTDDKVLTFFEINGAELNPKPAAEVFDFNLNHVGSIPFPHIEYRVTDAALTSDNKIWVINYFFPGDTDMLPKVDPLAKFDTDKKYDQVERLVEFDYNESGITMTDSAPVQIPLVEDARNWEGLVLLDERGFLVVTDKFPTTILGFVGR
jgi:hypothetical protein